MPSNLKTDNSENELLQWLRGQHQHSRAAPLWALRAKRPENKLNYFTIWGHLSHRQDVMVNTSSKWQMSRTDATWCYSNVISWKVSLLSIRNLLSGPFKTRNSGTWRGWGRGWGWRGPTVIHSCIWTFQCVLYATPEVWGEQWNSLPSLRTS